MDTLINDAISRLELMGEEKRVLMVNSNHPTSMKVLGVINPNQKIVLKELRQKTKSYSGSEKLDLAKLLIDTKIFECQVIAFEYIGRDKTALSVITEKEVDGMNVNLDNWVSVDTYSIFILGYAWRTNIISTEKIVSIFQSEDVWQRRSALVATVALNQKSHGGTGDVKRTLKLCELALADHHPMITKALSWSLRELSKVDVKPVKDFIEKYEKKLHSRVLREVTNKIQTGKKTV